MKKLGLLTVMLLTMVRVHCQELTIPTYTQYLADNSFVISPAYAGIGDYIKIRANGLTQWVGIKNAPDMQSVAADGRFTEKDGVGIFIYNDRNGFTHQSGGKLSYAHHLILDKTDDEFLSFGLSYNMNQFRHDNEAIMDAVNSNPSTAGSYSIEDRKIINHNFDVALLYRLNNFYISFNANNILDKEVKVFNQNEPTKLRNYQTYIGYNIKPKSSTLEYEPSVFIQYFESDRRSSTDLNFKVRKAYNRNNDYYFAGISYRFLNDQIMDPLNIGPMAGIKWNKFYFAYSYQIITNELFGYDSGTHMITIGMDIFQGVSNCRCTL
ncbi:PorP/SprF family type IX secretion system membrane protein [Mangrovimonas aestuarii]|uniref:PorP/SprF family type IX secretion system membrane protein n=1 Tax=Mangrovimonas aestuarii TaxID=3018443 RepID=UPI0023794345|nr:type IX secretion system membrane protein PorP/SprF [Mangrovimonas aestuarii]